MIKNDLCWYIGLMEQPEQALLYCEQAIQDLDLEDNFYFKYKPGFIHDSRGLVYARLGRYQEAAADLQIYIDEIQGNDAAEIVAKRNQRLVWVKTLKAGQNPFTPEVLAELRGSSGE